jgi:hypothetical protein
MGGSESSPPRRTIGTVSTNPDLNASMMTDSNANVEEDIPADHGLSYSEVMIDIIK